MKRKISLLSIVLVLSMYFTAYGDTELDRAGTLQLFGQLTSQPRKTWIPAGMIEATREEYRAPKTTETDEIDNQISQQITEYQNNQDKQELTEELQKMKLDAIPFNVRYELSNECTMNSTVIVRFDGDRFYWEINVNSRDDSVKPDTALADNFMAEQFNLNWNSRRIFAWDGEKYTTYSAPGNHAIVDSTGDTPHVVNGPLTAGVIPWGYGYYSYDSLVAAESSAIETIVNSQKYVHLTVNNSNGAEMVFMLDAGKNYAVISCTMNGLGNVAVSNQYSNYQLVVGNWVPGIILTERYDATSNRLLTRDLWEITSINGSVPPPESFEVEYETDTLIEFVSGITNKPAMYRYSDMVDTDELLAERLTYAANENSQLQNCATAALKCALSQLGKTAADEQLAQLVSGPYNQTTSLSAMKQFTEALGLYCRAVTTDISTLKNLDNCQVILHIPGKNHFVLLDDIDSRYVRIIDLANNKFYYRTDVGFFGMDWTEGTALLISEQPVTGEFTDIDDARLGSIIGAAYYDCNRILQEYNVAFCTYIGYECEGYYKTFYERWGCGLGASGSCSTSVMVRYRKCPCIEDPYYPIFCIGTGEWTYYYMRACA